MSARSSSRFGCAIPWSSRCRLASSDLGAARGRCRHLPRSAGHFWLRCDRPVGSTPLRAHIAPGLAGGPCRSDDGLRIDSGACMERAPRSLHWRHPDHCGGLSRCDSGFDLRPHPPGLDGSEAELALFPDRWGVRILARRDPTQEPGIRLSKWRSLRLRLEMAGSP